MVEAVDATDDFSDDELLWHSKAAKPRTKTAFPARRFPFVLRAIYWEPIGNGQRFVVLRSVPVTGCDNRINVIIN